MKPYGYDRTDNKTCYYGCCNSRHCAFKYQHRHPDPATNAENHIRRAHRKKARREARKEVCSATET